MSYGEPICVTLPLGAFTGATELPLLKIPNGFGGVTILEASLTGGAGTVIGGQLVTLADVASGSSPTLNGTIGAFAGTCVTAAGKIYNATISTAYVAEDYWIGYDQTSGTVPAGSFVAISYLVGK